MIRVLLLTIVVALALAAGAAIAMFRFKVGMLPTLAASALLGCGYFLLAGR